MGYLQKCLPVTFTYLFLFPQRPGQVEPLFFVSLQDTYLSSLYQGPWWFVRRPAQTTEGAQLCLIDLNRNKRINMISRSHKILNESQHFGLGLYDYFYKGRGGIDLLFKFSSTLSLKCLIMQLRHCVISLWHSDIQPHMGYNIIWYNLHLFVFLWMP